jgi:hypothetical protein
MYYSVYSVILKGKAGPLQAWSGPEGSRKLRFPDFLTTDRMVIKLSALRTGRVYPRKYSWYSFLLEAELTPGPFSYPEIILKKKTSFIAYT